jgi:hypothetical protein
LNPISKAYKAITLALVPPVSSLARLLSKDRIVFPLGAHTDYGPIQPFQWHEFKMCVTPVNRDTPQPGVLSALA